MDTQKFEDLTLEKKELITVEAKNHLDEFAKNSKTKEAEFNFEVDENVYSAFARLGANEEWDIISIKDAE